MSTTESPQPNTAVDPAGAELSPRFWFVLMLTGVVAGIAGGAMMRLLYFVEHSAWSYQGTGFLLAVTRATPGRRILILALAGILIGLARPLQRLVFANAGGDVETAIWLKSGRVEFLATITKAIVAIISVGLGISLGRESPIKQTGGAIAAKFSGRGSLTPQQQKLLVACGVGAGMASAYNVPLGGAVFAAEVLIGSFTLRSALPALVASALATAASWIFLPIEQVYHIPELSMSASLLIWSLPAGLLLGLAAVVLVRAIAWAGANKPGGLAVVYLPIAVMTSLGVLAIAFPQLLGNGKDTVQSAFANAFSFRMLLALAALKLIATAGCVRSGASGGLFTPTMTVGALLGGAMGYTWSLLWPGNGDHTSYAVVGATAVLAAATRGPVSSLVLVLEMTRRVDATMVPLLIAVTAATMLAGRLETRSIYSARVFIP